MKDMLFTETIFSSKDFDASDSRFFQLQKESRQIMKELPKRDEALRNYTEIVKTARPGLYPEGAVQRKA